MSGHEKCPVDHASLAASTPNTSADKCPVDHKDPSTTHTWSSLFPSSASPSPLTSPSAPAPLPLDRETSSIPKLDGTPWVYPSQAQFFRALARKHRAPRAGDMPVVVPIHNAVNERAWAHIRGWEDGAGGERCGGVRLVSFRGRPGERSVRARWRVFWGYAPPFDRHDWVVDRCGTRTRYIIDFYTGKPSAGAGAGNVSFYLDVRPALDGWDGVRLRARRLWRTWVGGLVERGEGAGGAERPQSS